MSTTQKLNPSFIILYVKNVLSSVEFYQSLLGTPPINPSPGFALFALDGGPMLGLWRIDDVLPAASVIGGQELAFAVESRDLVHSLLSEWSDKGWTIVQQPTDMDFGFTFTALDPDGHRLRIMVPNA
jgi:predicted lactoylglutathione lyase